MAKKVTAVHYTKGLNKILSNFAEAPFTFRGKQFKTAEGAYQSFKSGKYVEGFEGLSGSQAKYKGSRIPVDKKISVRLMSDILLEKHKQVPEFREALKSSGQITHPVEDKFWGQKFPEILERLKAHTAKKRLPMNFEFGNQGLPGTQKTTFDEIFKGKRRSTLRSYDHGLNVGDIVEVISANPRRIGEVKITGIRDVDASMAEEISKTERWTPDYIKKRLSGGKKTQQIFYEPTKSPETTSQKTKLTGKKSDDLWNKSFSEHNEVLESANKLKEGTTKLSGGEKRQKDTSPLNLRKLLYKGGEDRKTPAENRELQRMIGEEGTGAHGSFSELLDLGPDDQKKITSNILKKTWDTGNVFADIVKQELSPEIEASQYYQAKKDPQGKIIEPAKRTKMSLNPPRYIYQDKIDVIKAFLSHRIDQVSAEVAEQTGPSFNYQRESYPDGPVLLNKKGPNKGKPKKNLLKHFVYEHGTGHFEPREKFTKQGKQVDWVWVPGNKATDEYPTAFSMRPSTDDQGHSKQTPWEKVEGLFSDMLTASKERGYHVFKTSAPDFINPKTKKAFDRDIIISHEALESIVKEHVPKMLFAKNKSSLSKFSFGNIDYDTPRKRLEGMAGETVLLDQGGVVREDDPRTTGFRYGVARGSDDLQFDERTKLVNTAWGAASENIRSEGHEPGVHKSGQDISEGALSRGTGVPPGYIGRGGPEYTTTRNLDKQLLLPVMEEVSFTDTMKIDPKKDAAKQLLHGVLMNEVLEEADKIQKVQAASATGWDNEVDISKVHQFWTNDFVEQDANMTVQEELAELRTQYNNMIKEIPEENQALYQETRQVLQNIDEAYQADVAEKSYVVARAKQLKSQIDKKIKNTAGSQGISPKDKKLSAITLKLKDQPKIIAEESSKVSFGESHDALKLHEKRMSGGLYQLGTPESDKIEAEVLRTGRKKDVAKYLSYWGGINKMAEDHLASKGLLSEFVTGPEPAPASIQRQLTLFEPNVMSKALEAKVAPSEPIVAPEAEKIVPQKTTSVTVDGKSHVLTHNVNIHPGQRSTQLTLVSEKGLKLEPGEVPDVKAKVKYPLVGIQDQLENVKPASVTELTDPQAELKSGKTVKYQRQYPLALSQEPIELVKSKTATALTGDETWMTRQQRLRTAANEGISKVGSSVSPKLGTLAFGLSLVQAPIQWGLAYRSVQRQNEQEALYGLGTDGATGPEPSWGNLGAPVSDEDWKNEFWHRMTGGATPSAHMINWQRNLAQELKPPPS